VFDSGEKLNDVPAFIAFCKNLSISSLEVLVFTMFLFPLL
jgi:hypothetical protein